MEGRYGFSEGFPEGKSEGWNGTPKACPPEGGGGAEQLIGAFIKSQKRTDDSLNL